MKDKLLVGKNGKKNKKKNCVHLMLKFKIIDMLMIKIIQPEDQEILLV